MDFLWNSAARGLELPPEVVSKHIKTEIVDIPHGNTGRDDAGFKGEKTHGTSTSSLTVDTSATEANKDHRTFKEGILNNMVLRTFTVYPDSRSPRCSVPSSVKHAQEVDGGVNHVDKLPVHVVVKEESPEADQVTPLRTYYVQDPDTGNLINNCDDTKPAVGVAQLKSGDVSTQAHCETWIPDSKIPQGVTPVGLFYNTAHLGRFVTSQEREVHEGPQRVSDCKELQKVQENAAEDVGITEKELRDVRNSFDHVDDAEKRPGIDVASGCINGSVNKIGSDIHPETSVHEREKQGVKSSHSGFHNMYFQADEYTEAGWKIYRCIICRKPFLSPYNLRAHMRSHPGEKVYSCKICNKSFPHPSNLQKHIRTHTSEKPYSCKFCDKSFSQSGNLKLHERTHTGEKPYSCKICVKSFAVYCSLQNHLRTHTGEKPYTCSICTRSFSVSCNLQAHMRTHTGEKPYTCQICNRSFAESSSLRKHEHTHTAVKPYICKVCGKSFAQFCYLRKHERTHTVEKSHTCKVCGKSFAQPGYLHQHLGTHAGEKP